MIKVRNLSYAYNKGTPREKLALKNVSLKINSGETAVIIGGTGSGKSTLVQHFNGLLRPSEGEVIIDGQDIKNVKVKDICKSVGLVFQYPENQLFEETVYKDIAFGAKNLGLSESEINKRVIKAADMVGLGRDCLDKSPFELSGGQMRRAAIAGVLAMQPRILILDEPTAGLDGEGRRTVIELIKRLRGEGVTVVLVSHSMEDAAELADRVIVMNDGEVVIDADKRTAFSDADRLQKIGLDVPKATSVMRRLREMGYSVSGDVFTAKDAAAEIKRALGERNV